MSKVCHISIFVFAIKLEIERKIISGSKFYLIARFIDDKKELYEKVFYYSILCTF